MKVKYGEIEIRFAENYPEPFPLFPKEELILKPTNLQIVRELEALKIEALRDFVNSKGEKIKAGHEWLFKGAASYKPRIEEKVVTIIYA